jgi:hypothetical protein
MKEAHHLACTAHRDRTHDLTEAWPEQKECKKEWGCEAAMACYYEMLTFLTQSVLAIAGGAQGNVCAMQGRGILFFRAITRLL